MNARLPPEIHAEFARRLRAAWLHVNQAGDTPDARRSILELHAALRELLAVDSGLHTDSTPAALAARHHHGLARPQPDAAGLLEALAARALEIQAAPQSGAENVHDPLLVHAAMPVLWRIVRSLRHDLRRRRPRFAFRHMARHIPRLLLSLLVLVCAVQVIRWEWPWGCRIVYRIQGEPSAVRGWGVAAALDKDYGLGRPLPWMHHNRWSAEWRGVLQVPEDADYAFYAQCEGGMRLWLDDQLLVDNWNSAGWTAGAQHAARRLAAGAHPLRLEFQDRGGRAAVRVRWAGGPIPPNTIVGAPYLRKF